MERGEDEEGLPAQILCFLNINDWNDKQYKIGPYAVVRKFESPPKQLPGNKSNLVWNGRLVTTKLHLMHCDTILNTVAVVQDNFGTSSHNQFLVVRSQSYWLESFEKKLLWVDNHIVNFINEVMKWMRNLNQTMSVNFQQI